MASEDEQSFSFTGAQRTHVGPPSGARRLAGVGPVPRRSGIRVRDLTGPNLRHGVLIVMNELAALELAEAYGDEIALLDDGKTLDVSEPVVPPQLARLVMSDPVLLRHGSEMNFRSLRC